MKIKYTLSALLGGVLLLGQLVMAHNKVVVIPMGGDDTELEPFALIPADNTSPANYTSADGVTLDRVTGLEWQQVDSNVNYTFDGANGYCNTLTLDGESNWRLPTAKELLSIVDFGTFSPAVDGSAFPATDSVTYWTATDLNTINDFRWTVGFASGGHLQAGELGNRRVRCVRSNGQNALVSVFNDNGDGSVTDLASGLIWEQQYTGDTYDQAAGISYCQSLVLAGSSNWRLPQVKELASLLDYRESNPATDAQLFPIPGPFFDYMSVSVLASDMSSAWGVGFGTGDAFSAPSTFETLVRCVR